MLHKRIMEMISILNEEDLNEIEVRTFFRTIRISRIKSGRESPSLPETEKVQAHAVAPILQAAPGTRPTAEPASPPQEAPPAVAEQTVDPRLKEVLSPMVGTFYKSPSPQADPFVVPGSRVTIGQTLCIIEAMKLMNEIEAEIEGVIRKVLVRDGQPVEFGQPLFLIESA